MANQRGLRPTQAQDVVASRDYVQEVYDRPRRIFLHRYITAKGKRLLQEGKISAAAADKYYGKNRYAINKDAKVIKSITHTVTDMKNLPKKLRKRKGKN